MNTWLVSDPRSSRPTYERCVAERRADQDLGQSTQPNVAHDAGSDGSRRIPGPHRRLINRPIACEVEPHTVGNVLDEALLDIRQRRTIGVLHSHVDTVGRPRRWKSVRPIV
jgi:hypothetical protein